ncbi:MAG: gliding motility-associated C-terminal domain-containing protein [Saprospiraceae bacterium]|nr:gliding motility-associated C-terminal domain-containing protein [Saprospiraceae bacterium]
MEPFILRIPRFQPYLLSKSSGIRRVHFENAQFTITGTSKDSGYFGYELNQYSIDIFGNNFQSFGGTSTFDVTDPRGKLFVKLNGMVELGSLIFSNATGTSEILNYELKSSLSFTGNVTFNHNTNFLSSANLKTLRLSPGYVYNFVENGQYNLDNIEAMGSCTKMTLMSSVSAGTAVRFVTKQTTTTDFITLRDIHLSGAAGTANNVIDLGNNNGWTLNAKTTANLYWVGGTGNWSQGIHWATTSGGAPSGCIPTAVDHVFFDANSFSSTGQIVTVDVESAFTNNMTWASVRDSSTLKGDPGMQLFINGSLELASNMKNDFIAPVHFISNQKGNTLKSNGVQLRNDVYFNNVSGSWVVVDNLNIDNFLFHVAGELTFDDIKAEAHRYFSGYEQTRIFNMKASTFHLHPQSNRNFFVELNINTRNYTLNAGTSKVILDGSYYCQLYVNDRVSNNVTFYDVEFGSPNSTLTMYSEPVDNYQINHLKFRDDGSIAGIGIIDSLEFAGGHNYTLASNITVNKIIANADCNANITLLPEPNLRVRPTINFTSPQTVNGLYIKSIVATVTGGSLVEAVNSIDAGNNTGWNFTKSTGRTLYFVRNTAYWDDMANWSLTSGGAGGQCIPTLLDNVIMDNNSFPNKALGVEFLLASGSCKDFTFNVDNYTGFIRLNFINFAGNVTLLKNANWGVDYFNAVGVDGKQLIRTTGNKLFNFVIKGESEIELEDDFYLQSSFIIRSGKFLAQNKKIDIFNIFSQAGLTNPVMELQNSHMIIRGEGAANTVTCYVTSNATVNSIGSKIEFTNKSASMWSESATSTFGTILFSNIEGIGFLSSNEKSSFAKVDYKGDGQILTIFQNTKSINLDTLVLSSGHFYQIPSNYDVNINQLLQARGNNCNPISLTSSIMGTKANMVMPASARVNADFIEMRDIRGVGGAVFDAGPYSTDIANSNVNWIFPELEVDNNIGVLGPDRFICNGESVQLDATSYTVDETYLWNNGTTNAILSANTAGLYAVRITFQNNCVLLDTIELFTAASIENFLPNDTVICDKGSFVASGKIVNPDITYLWSNNSTNPEITIDKAGLYKLEITLDGCSFRDSFSVDYIDFDNIKLGNDRSVCEGTEIVLKVAVQSAAVTWSDGSTGDSIEVNATGDYWVEVSRDLCTVRDSINIVVNPIPKFSLGTDTIFCEGNTLNLTPNFGSAQVLWQDGNTSQNYRIDKTGLYVAKASLNGCDFVDSIQVQVTATPKFEFGKDTVLCNDQIMALLMNPDADSYRWQDGSTALSFEVQGAGTYIGTAFKSGCQFSDTIKVEYFELNKPTLRADTTVCNGIEITLLPGAVNGSDLLWSNGSTSSFITINSAGTYWVESQRLGCKERDSFSLFVLTNPEVNLEPSYTYCEGESKTIEAKGNFDNFVWQNNGPGSILEIAEDGEYTYKAFKGICESTGAITVSKVNVPEPNLGNDIQICRGDIQRIGLPPFPGTQAYWQDGTRGFAYDVTAMGVYTITVTYLGCESSDSIYITDRICNDQVLFFPNILSIGSSKNNSFLPMVNPDFNIETYSLSIFDRLGNVVFETSDIEQPWNGLFGTRPMVDGVYTYLAKYTYSGRKEGSESVAATITVLR